MGAARSSARRPYTFYDNFWPIFGDFAGNLTPVKMPKMFLIGNFCPFLAKFGYFQISDFFTIILSLKSISINDL